MANRCEPVRAEGEAGTPAVTAEATGEAETAGGAPAAGQEQAAEVEDGTAGVVVGTAAPDDAELPARGFDPLREDQLALHARVKAGLRATLTGSLSRRAGRDAILPLSEPTVDPDTVPGRKLVTATAQVRHDGRSYAPGERFPVDFRAHAQLVPVGAIEAVPWHALPDHDDD